MTNSCKAFLLVAFASIGVTACGGGDNATSPAPASPGIAPTSQATPQSPATKPALGETCASTQAGHICLALNYVVYNEAGSKNVTPAVAADNVHTINQAYSQCNIGFQIEKFATVSPTDYGLSDGVGTLNELDRVRQVFAEDTELLVVTTGVWGTQKNAWTQPPGAGVYGAILEFSAGAYAPIIGHELGHYLGLDHVSDESNMMNPVIYAMGLYPSQCDQMRATAAQYWQKMYR